MVIRREDILPRRAESPATTARATAASRSLAWPPIARRAAPCVTWQKHGTAWPCAATDKADKLWQLARHSAAPKQNTGPRLPLDETIRLAHRPRGPGPARSFLHFSHWQATLQCQLVPSFTPASCISRAGHPELKEHPLNTQAVKERKPELPQDLLFQRVCT